jgi:DNA polymerase III subunit alpha
VPRWTESERLAREKEILGFFISGHPLERYRDEVRVFETGQHGDAEAVPRPEGGAGVRRHGGQPADLEEERRGMGPLTVEDFYGTATVLAFGDVWEQYHDLLTQDAPVLLRGSVSGRDRDEDAPPIFLDSVVPLASCGQAAARWPWSWRCRRTRGGDRGRRRRGRSANPGESPST